MTTSFNQSQLLCHVDATWLTPQDLGSHFAVYRDTSTSVCETYATILAALFLLGSEEVSATKSRLFQILLVALKLGEDSQAKLLDQAKSLDQAKLTEFFDLAEKNKLTWSFMRDALILFRLGSPLSTELSKAPSKWMDVLEMGADHLPILGKLTVSEELGLSNLAPWGVEWRYCGFGVLDKWLAEKPLTEAALKAGICDGRWVLSQDLTVHFPWTMEGAVVRFENSAILSTHSKKGRVGIRHTQLVLPRLKFEGIVNLEVDGMSLEVEGVQVSGKWPEEVRCQHAISVQTLEQCTIEDSMFSTPNRSAIYIADTPARLQRCRFVECGNSEIYGGGLHAINGGQLLQMLQISDSEFLRCAGREGGGIWVRGDATLTDCSFIDCSSTGDKLEQKGRSAAGYFYAPLVDTLKNCRFVRSSVRGENIGYRGNTTKKITFCAGSSFTSCDLNCSGSVHSDSMIDQGNTFAGGAMVDHVVGGEAARAKS